MDKTKSDEALKHRPIARRIILARMKLHCGIFIRQEADAHARLEPICRRAASRRANNSGFDSLRAGIL